MPSAYSSGRMYPWDARREDRSGGGSRLALVSSAIRFTPCVPLRLGARQLANRPPECDEKPED